MSIEVSDKYLQASLHNSTTIIWRYLSIWKFIDLVETSQLHCCPVTAFDNDPCEGRLTTSQYQSYKESPYFKERTQEQAKKFLSNSRGQYGVLCWYADSKENNLMWQLYGREGVAIQSTIGSLVDSIILPEDFQSYITSVVYADAIHEAYRTKFEKIMICTHKLYAYRDEREIRLIIKKPLKKVEGDPILYADPLNGDESRIDVDLSKLIKKVVVYPGRERQLLPFLRRAHPNFLIEKSELIPEEVEMFF